MTTAPSSVFGKTRRCPARRSFVDVQRRLRLAASSLVPRRHAQPGRLAPDRAGAWASVVVAVLLVVIMWPAWTTTDRLVIGGDTLLIHFPWFVLWRDALGAGQLPMWNPYTLGGLPSLPTLQSGFGYPPHWLLTWLPAVQAINWSIGLHVLLAGLGAAWCAGRMGTGPEGSVLAGVAYALGSATTARLWAGHLSFLEANAWLPVATGCALGVRTRREVVVLAGAAAMLTLAGQPEVAIFSLWWLPAWAVAGAVRTGAVRTYLAHAAGALLRVALGVGLGGCLAAWQLLPTLALLGISNRAEGMSWDFRTDASLPVWHLLGVIAPTVFGDPRGTYWPGPSYQWHERVLYVGLVPLLAATRVPGRWRWVCAGTGLLAVALAFGRYAPWYAWAQALPGYVSFRIPSKHLTLAALAVCLAGGAGLHRLRGWRVAAAAAGGGVVVACAGLTLGAWLPPLARLVGGAELLPAQLQPAPATTAAAVALLAVAVAALLPGAWATRTLLVLAALDLIVVFGPFRLASSDPWSVAAGLADAPASPRLAVAAPDAALDGNFGPVVHIAQPSGYTSLFSAGYAQLLLGTRDPGVVVDLTDGDPDLLRLLGYPARWEPAQKLLTIFSSPPPRAWVARCAQPGGAAEARAPGFPMRSCVTAQGLEAATPPAEAAQATLTAESAGSLDVAADGPGWLVTDQPSYPGWSADVDGLRQPVTVLDGALVGVRLTSGTHFIRLRYAAPDGFGAGLVVAALAGLVLAGLWLTDPRLPCWPRRFIRWRQREQTSTPSGAPRPHLRCAWRSARPPPA